MLAFGESIYFIKSLHAIEQSNSYSSTLAEVKYLFLSSVSLLVGLLIRFYPVISEKNTDPKENISAFYENGAPYKTSGAK